MNTLSRKITILSSTPRDVLFQHIPEGQVVSMSKYVFNQFLLSGAYEAINLQGSDKNIKTSNYEKYQSKSFKIQTPQSHARISGKR